jgi:hypothetical protein
MKPLFRLLGFLMIGGGFLSAQGQTPRASDNQPLATVDDYPITEAAVLRWLKKSLPNAAADSPAESKPPKFHPSLVQGALEHLVNRRIVFDYLDSKGLQISADETRLELEKLSSKLAATGRTTKDYLETEGISSPELEFEIQWELAWKRYLTKALTDDYLQQHFTEHRRRFDKSEMRVAHLLIRVDENRPESVALKLAEQVYKQIHESTARGPGVDVQSGAGKSAAQRVSEAAWNQAVKQHSDAPSKQEAGELGWIRFYEPMPEFFSAAAFALNPGEVSRPTVTRFGVHLIRCQELREGKMGWRDAQAAVRDHAAKTLFDRIVTEHRGKVSIKNR